MKKLFMVPLVLIALNQMNAQAHIDIEADGNLDSPHPLACVALSEVTNEDNPADILHGLQKCLESKEYKKAAQLFAISGVYGKYDALRVKDKSAHQALLVLQQNIFLNLAESETTTFMKYLQEELKAGSTNLNEICDAIQKIGAPKYFPKYMIQHGMQAFLDKKDDGLVKEFDSQVSWNLVRNSYLHCGAQ